MVGVKYTKHALVKMEERGLSPEVVEEVLFGESERFTNTLHRTMIAVKRGNGRPVVVAYRLDGDAVVVVTVFSPENINKLVERRVLMGRWKPWSR